jgi:Chitin binding Peritrophin-A domain
MCESWIPWFKIGELSFEVLIGLVMVAAIHAATAQECSEKAHNAMWPASNNNQNYYRCVQKQGRWMPQQMCCPSGSVFNRCMNICMWQWQCNWQCCGGGGTTTPPTTTPRPPVQLCEQPECNSDQMQIRWPTRTANSYYECTNLNTAPAVRFCSGTNLFNFFQQECLSAASWIDVCPALP